FHAATHGRGHDPAHLYAVLAKCLAESLALLASQVIQVPLGRAVVDPHARRVAPVTRRRVAVANDRDMAAGRQRGPGFLGILCGKLGRDYEHGGKSTDQWAQLARHVRPPCVDHASNRVSSLRSLGVPFKALRSGARSRSSTISGIRWKRPEWSC